MLGTGLGILRSDSPGARSLNSMTPEAHEKVLEKRLLIITKANSRATVHRSAYLDYIGFKIFNGRARWSGSDASWACSPPPRTGPACRSCRWSGARSPRCSTARPEPAQPLRQGPAADPGDLPRDELFQIKTDDLYHAVIGVLRMAGRRQLRFLRRDADGRFISCPIYLPRDRFTTQNRLRMQDIRCAS
ncbi:hypothetical protein V2I01_06235 [Micromonospora sp. BRA006-A]|nr:hypothetical protein [Micromonospora sp. BRA006-A]